MGAKERDHAAALSLIEEGASVHFEVISTQIIESTDPGEFAVVIDLSFPGEDGSGENDLAWGAFGFLFVIAILSFNDARPRESSALEYTEDDALQMADLLTHLDWRSDGALRLDTDYLRGRRMKTELVLLPNGSGRLTTRGRGKSAVLWLEQLQGKKRLQVV